MNGKLIGDKPCKVSLEPHVIVIDNLPEGMQVDDLVKLYSSYGDIQDANIEMVSEGSIRFLRGYIGFWAYRLPTTPLATPTAAAFTGTR